MLTHSAKEYMIKTLHKYHRGDKWVNEILGATGKDLENAGDKLQQDYNNLFFDTCSESGAQVYEKDLGIYNHNESLEVRRLMIQSKWLARGFSCVPIIQTIADKFYQSSLRVDYEDAELQYISNGNRLSNFDKFLNAVNEIKPAHIDYGLTIDFAHELNYYVGILNATIGKKQINLPNVPDFQQKLYSGVGHFRAGKATVSIQKPPSSEANIYVGTIIRRTGRITIGGKK